MTVWDAVGWLAVAVVVAVPVCALIGWVIEASLRRRQANDLDAEIERLRGQVAVAQNLAASLHARIADKTESVAWLESRLADLTASADYLRDRNEFLETFAPECGVRRPRERCTRRGARR